MPGLFMSTSRQVMPLCLAAVGVGADDQQAQVGEVGKAGPDLLAVDDEMVAVEHGLGFERSQVAAGVGLGKTLAPDFVARKDAGQVALLLRLGADGDDRRPDQALADRAPSPGASARAISSWKMACSMNVAPRPPNSLGQAMPA